MIWIGAVAVVALLGAAVWAIAWAETIWPESEG